METKTNREPKFGVLVIIGLIMIAFVLRVAWVTGSLLKIWYFNNSGMITITPVSGFLTGVVCWLTFLALLASAVLYFWEYFLYRILDEDEADAVFFQNVFFWALGLLVYPIVVYQGAWMLSYYLDQEGSLSFNYQIGERLGSLLVYTRFGVLWVGLGVLLMVAGRKLWMRQKQPNSPSF